jgi:L-rhamnose mutarotase
MTDYSIHFLEQEHLLIAHVRYIGDDYEGDMAQIGKSEATQKWWKVCLFHLLIISALQQGQELLNTSLTESLERECALMNR